MVILRTQNKITDFLMILAWASPFNRQGNNEKIKTTCRTDSLEYVVRTSLKNVSCGYVKECSL